MKCSKIVISALRGGSGKTLLSIGIIAALRKKKYSVAPFKKGPDYIDTGWLALSAGRPCYNLDTFLIPEDEILNSFLLHTSSDDIAVIEGNRGLYDSIHIQGDTSTAELAKLLKAPVVLCLDCTKTTRTMAAVLLGLMQFDPGVNIQGVILNRVAGARHEQILTKSIEHHCGIPVLGVLPKLKEEIFPERHMGLVPTPEHTWAKESIEKTARIASSCLDLDAITKIAANAGGDIEPPYPSGKTPHVQKVDPVFFKDTALPKIGIIKDSAFQFYYPENIEALVRAGAEILFISPLADETIPPVDALYIGGGFPETHAIALAKNTKFKSQLKALADNGLPIYAECGGLMYLGKAMVLQDKTYPMAGVLPVVFGLFKKPQGHGYTIVSVEKENPFFTVGTKFKGHEFHYSKVLQWHGNDDNLVFSMKRGAGFLGGKDGVCYKNVLATYTHVHSLGFSAWSESMVKNAALYKSKPPPA